VEGKEKVNRFIETQATSHLSIEMERIMEVQDELLQASFSSKSGDSSGSIQQDTTASAFEEGPHVFAKAGAETDFAVPVKHVVKLEEDDKGAACLLGMLLRC
jgi:hypothetical protein